MLGVQPQLGEHPGLRRAGGREHLRAEVARDLQRRHADATGRRVNQQRLAALQAGKIDERVIGRQEHDRHRRRLHERPILGDRNDQLAVGHRDRAKSLLDQTHHPVARREILHVLSDLQHHAGALAADADRRPARQQTERHEHVTEVQPACVHRDPHLARA